MTFALVNTVKVCIRGCRVYIRLQLTGQLHADFHFGLRFLLFTNLCVGYIFPVMALVFKSFKVLKAMQQLWVACQ